MAPWNSPETVAAYREKILSLAKSKEAIAPERIYLRMKELLLKESNNRLEVSLFHDAFVAPYMDYDTARYAWEFGITPLDVPHDVRTGPVINGHHTISTEDISLYLRANMDQNDHLMMEALGLI